MPIREGDIHDAHFIWTLGQEVFDIYSTNKGGELCLRCLQEPGAIPLIFEHDDVPFSLAVAILQMLDDRVYLAAIATLKEVRRHGYGKKLLAECLRRAETRAAGTPLLMMLHVAQGNTAAITLFESLGFRAKQIITNRYSNGEGALLMVKIFNGDAISS